MSGRRRPADDVLTTWTPAATLNVVIALSYVLIASLIVQGLVRTRQVQTNALAVATGAIFTTCAVHHGHHAAHLLSGVGGSGTGAELAAVRAVFGEWHTLLIDGVGAVVAVAYLSLRRNYEALLNTPQMFDDAVRSAAERRLHELAFTDLLTEIPNRAAYQQHADDLVDRNLPVSVLFIDLDGFKGVNDRYGHDVGDRLLRAVALRLRHDLRDGESVFRLGGDEFVVIGAGHDEAAAAGLCSRVSESVAGPVQVRGGELLVTASVGLATGSPGESVDELLRQADRGMFRIKRLKAAAHPPAPRRPLGSPAAPRQETG